MKNKKVKVNLNAELLLAQKNSHIDELLASNEDKRKKLNSILNLLTEKTHGKLRKQGVFTGTDESTGALIILTHVFNKAYEIYKQ